MFFGAGKVGIWQTTVLASLFGLLSGRVGAAADQASPQTEGTLPDYINQQLRMGWADNDIRPSPVAADEEWVRRAYLDLAGRIPSLVEVQAFLGDKSPRRRQALVDSLLESDDFVRHLTTTWTNNCIGRGTPRRVSRAGMEKFFRESFSRNRPWNQIVVDLVTGAGHFEENGAVNYILSQLQLDDDGVQLTAKTARLFLGLQVQCTQCHDHPFNKWQQNQFWEFNSFFRQVRKEEYRKLDPLTGRMVDDYSAVVWQDFSGPVYYEKRSGLMQVAFPKYFEFTINADAETDRRAEFGRLIVESVDGTPPLIAPAFINRTWSQFFGYGFTRPVDDMGPHNPVSHPALLDHLSRQFVAGGYNIRELIRAICNSEAYGLTSQTSDQNEIDNPAAGETALFSHMYLKPMQAEQLYDSLIVASGAHRAGQGGWSAQEQQRRVWMAQFIVAFDNDENDETTTFNGTIPQALMMMNGELIEKAVSTERGSFLLELLSRPGNDGSRIDDLYLTSLSRRPSRAEQQKALRMIALHPSGNRLLAWQDLFWVLLNSNEFMFVH